MTLPGPSSPASPSPALTDLARSMPPGRIVFDPDILISYSHDRAETAVYQIPAALARPQHTSEVAAIVRHCAEEGIPIVPRGAGTGLSGGANAVQGCLVMSLEAMNQILRIDPQERLAVVQPGVVNDDLRVVASAAGLWYPPDPASSPWSTVGGNVATNAGGVCCVKYGVTGDYVLGMQVVMGCGDVHSLGRRTAKGVAGYDLTSLLVGSEGTLGIITEITVRLRNSRPVEHTIAGYFADLPSAGRAVAAVMSSDTVPSALELVDRFCLQAVDDWKQIGLKDGGKVLLLARTDGAGAAEAAAVLACFESAGATWCAVSSDQHEAEALFQARRLVYPALERLGAVLTEDICVPRMLVPEMLERIERIAATSGIPIASLAHAGDGNVHPMIVIPHGDPDAAARAHQVLEQIIDESLRLGGTVTGEHGVGLLKMRGLATEVGPGVLELHRAVKRALDPVGIFNPGKVF